MADRSILRIGPITGTDNCGAAFLRDAIRRHFDGGANEDDQSTLTISNRYFNANIVLLGLDETYSDLSSSTNVNNKHGSITTVEEDGILLVFDDQSSHSFDSLGRIHDAIVVGVVGSAIGDLLRMCIGMHASTDDDNDNDRSSTSSIIDKDEYSRRVLWCLDRGYEYVSVDLSTRGMTTGFDVRDKDGYARVIEAIETCMWSCRVMKSSPCGSVQSSVVQQQRAAKGVNGMNNKIDDTGVTMSDDTTIQLMTDAERESAAIASLMNGTGDDDDDDGNGDYMPPSLGEGSELQSQLIRRQHQQQQERDEEISFHQLEKVLNEAKSIREASRNNANMSDEERRARAGDAAMKLMGLLDRLGFDDKDSDDEEGVGDCDSND